MTFPVVETTNTSATTAADTLITVNLPSGIVSGNLVCIFLRAAAAVTITWPSGWTNELFQESPDASPDVNSFVWRKADGTEGATITVNFSGSCKAAALAWRISGAADPTVQPPQNATAVVGTDAIPDPGSLSPTGGAKDYVWLWVGGWEGEQTSPPAGNPTNYGSNILGASTGTGGLATTNCRVASARRDLNIATEDPPSWTISAADEWSAYTIAIHPTSVADLSVNVNETPALADVLASIAVTPLIVNANDPVAAADVSAVSLSSLLPTSLWTPFPWKSSSAFPTSFTSILLDALNDAAAWVVQVPKDGTLDWFECRTGTVTTFENLRMSFQDPSASDGSPDGTADQYRIVTSNPGSNAWLVPPGVMSGDGTDGGAKRSVTRGQMLACVIDFDGTAGSINIASRIAAINFFNHPYSLHRDAGVWSKFRETIVLALKYNDGSYGYIPNCLPILTSSSQVINTGTTPDLVGARFRLPYSCEVGGFYVLLTPAAGADWRGILVPATWDGSEGQILAKTNTIDAEAGAGLFTGRYFKFTSPAQIALNTYYRLIFEPLTANSITVGYKETVSGGEAKLDTLDLGQDFHWTQAKDPTGDGSWTNTLTRRPWASIRVTAV